MSSEARCVNLRAYCWFSFLSKMAIVFSPTTATTPYSKLHNSSSLPFPVLPRRILISANLNPRLLRCHAALSPQPPPQSDPPPEKDPVHSKGVAATLSRFQDRAQIFLAVLFWMSLFFWSCLWDGRSNGRGRLNKGSRFKR